MLNKNLNFCSWRSKTEYKKFYQKDEIERAFIEHSRGRPVVSSVECYISKISKFVDQYLKTTSWSIKDTVVSKTQRYPRYSKFHQ